jgi:hypothetical protein
MLVNIKCTLQDIKAQEVQMILVVCRDLIDADIDEGSSPALPDLSPAQWDLILDIPPFQMATSIKHKPKQPRSARKLSLQAKQSGHFKQADCSEEDDEDDDEDEDDEDDDEDNDQESQDGDAVDLEDTSSSSGQQAEDASREQPEACSPAEAEKATDSASDLNVSAEGPGSESLREESGCAMTRRVEAANNFLKVDKAEMEKMAPELQAQVSLLPESQLPVPTVSTTTSMALSRGFDRAQSSTMEREFVFPNWLQGTLRSVCAVFAIWAVQWPMHSAQSTCVPVVCIDKTARPMSETIRL